MASSAIRSTAVSSPFVGLVPGPAQARPAPVSTVPRGVSRGDSAPFPDMGKRIFSFHA